ncbi:MAG: hypothetical protein GXY44_12785 [Phycisphaerales bacterium]|nr:hypothetical protein [Phycisphaerales bacterium]
MRNTMSSRDEGNIWPFHRRPDGTYDLEHLDDEHFRHFENLLRLALERDIIVQIEVWDRFDFAREHWLANPYRPANNVNYTPESSGLRNEYPRHPGSNDNPFFRSIPAHDNNRTLLKYQQAQVDRMLTIALKFPNVLYCMDNETNATAEWGAYWSDYIRGKASDAGVEIHTTEMWDNWNIKDATHLRTIDHPDIYSFIDISQNNHNKGQQHWDNLQWAWNYIAYQPRPLNHVKIYGADSGRYGSDSDGLERFWRGLIGGAASLRFHRPLSGHGLNELAQAHLRSARLLLEQFDIFNALPDSENQRLTNRAENEGYLSFIENKQYAVYFPDGGSVQLKLAEDVSGSVTIQWLDIANSRWQEVVDTTTGTNIVLKSPASGHWVALIRL